MAITFSNHGYAINTSSTTAVVTLNVTAGDLIWCGGWHGTSNTVSIADTQSNTYNVEVADNVANGVGVASWYAVALSTGSVTITLTTSDNAGQRQMWVMIFTGTSATPSVGTPAGATKSFTTNWASSSITPGVADFVLTTFAATSNNPTTPYWTPAASFTASGDEQGYGSAAYRIVTGGAGSYTGGFTAGDGTNQGRVNIGAYQAGAAGATFTIIGRTVLDYGGD